ncbi:hypothetical protein BH10BDE1_BH10BDE1_27980 [soil metagenome]
MRDIKRSIEDVRRLRGDLSTWLVHLTKGNIFLQNGVNTHFTPKDCLSQILSSDTINAVSEVGQFNYKSWYTKVQPADLKAVCFTETPVSEIFLFIGITNKALKFSSYGLVYDRSELAEPPVFAAPVLYFSQPSGNQHFLNQFGRLEQQHYSSMKDVLYLFDKFGKTFAGKDYNFMWEREWRIKGDFVGAKTKAKFGLCPEHDITFFEATFPGLAFVDPFFNPRQIETKLKDRGVI